MADNTDTGNGFIPKDLQKVDMRHRIENKELLSKKGSIYVGTGTVDESGYVKTEALEVGATGSFLTSNSNEDKGLKWEKDINSFSTKRIAVSRNDFLEVNFDTHNYQNIFIKFESQSEQ